MTLSAWEAYLENLCTNHPVLLHNTDGRRAWLPYENSETALVHSDISSPYVRHTGFFFNGRTEGQWYYTSVLLFLVNVPSVDGNLPEKIVAARNQAQEILEQVEARIWHDHNTRVSCELFEDIGDVQVEAVDMTDEQAYGWEMMITIAASKIEHDTELWLDTKTPE